MNGGARASAGRPWAQRATVDAVAIVLVGIPGFGFFVLGSAYIYWKAGVGACLALLGVAISHAMRAPPPRGRAIVQSSAMGLVALVPLLVMVPVWQSQWGHDRHLRDLVQQLCNISTADLEVEGCSGSITNTGNGNSCRYAARATAWMIGTTTQLRTALLDAGFSPTALDQFGDVMDDGRTYFDLASEDRVATARLSLQESWQDQEDDLRCT